MPLDKDHMTFSIKFRYSNLTRMPKLLSRHDLIVNSYQASESVCFVSCFPLEIPQIEKKWWFQMDPNGWFRKKRYSGIIVFVLWKKWWFDDFLLICGSPMRRIPQIIQEMTDFQHSYCLFGPTVISLCKSPILSWLKRLDVYRCLFVGYIYICYRSISLPNDWQNNDVQIILMLSLDTPNYYIKLLNQVSWLVG